MALSVTVVTATGGGIYGQPAQLAQKGGQGWLRVRVATLTGDTAYPSGPGGGYPITASTFQLYTQIVGLHQIGTSSPTAGLVGYDYSNQVLRVYHVGVTTPSEAGSGTNLSTFTARVMVWGI